MVSINPFVFVGRPLLFDENVTKVISHFYLFFHATKEIIAKYGFEIKREPYQAEKMCRRIRHINERYKYCTKSRLNGACSFLVGQ